MPYCTKGNWTGVQRPWALTGLSLLSCSKCLFWVHKKERKRSESQRWKYNSQIKKQAFVQIWSISQNKCLLFIKDHPNTSLLRSVMWNYNSVPWTLTMWKNKQQILSLNLGSFQIMLLWFVYVGFLLVCQKIAWEGHLKAQSIGVCTNQGF